MSTRTAQRKPAPRASKGLSVRTFKGLNKKRMASGGGSGLRVVLKQGETGTFQFLDEPSEMREIERHEFQEDGKWNFVPCAGDDCPLCDDEEEDKAKSRYRFYANVYDIKQKKVLVLDGPKDLAGRVFAKYERKASMFKKRVWDISKLGTTPVSYDVDLAEKDPVPTTRLEKHDLDDYLLAELKRYYGDDLEAASTGKSALEDDDDIDDEDEDDEEDGPDEDEMGEMRPSELKRYAREVGLSRTTIDGVTSRAALIRRIVKKRGY